MRKMILGLTIACLIVLSSGVVSAEHIVSPDPPKSSINLVEVSPSVVMLVNEHGSNVTCIALDTGLIFIDAGLSTEVASLFRQKMEARFERDTEALILTHGHLDHIFGMGAFSDVNIFASEDGRPLIEKQLAIDWTEKNIAIYTGIFPTFSEDVGTATPRLPNNWVSESLTLGKDKNIATFRVNGGHTTDSSHVFFPSEGVLVSGDLVQVDKYPYFGDPTNDLGRWIQVLNDWRSWPVTKVCPGHGGVVGPDYLALMQGFFEDLLDVLVTLKASELPVEEVVVHEDLPEGYWPEQPEPRWWKMCIARAYSVVEGA